MYLACKIYWGKGEFLSIFFLLCKTEEDGCVSTARNMCISRNKITISKIYVYQVFKQLPPWFFPILAIWVTVRVGKLRLENDYHRKVDNLKRSEMNFAKNELWKKIIKLLTQQCIIEI